MKKKTMKFLVVIFIVNLSCGNTTEEMRKNSAFTKTDFGITSDTLNVKNKPLDDLMHRYDTSQILTAFYFLFDRQGNLLPKNLSSDSSCNPLSSESDKHLLKVEAFLTSRTDRASVIAALEKWCENDKLLNVVINSQMNANGTVYFEEVVSLMPQLQNLLKKYIKSKDQYWGSLDVSQSCKLYFDVLIFLQQLNEKERLKFFKLYTNICFDKLLK